MDPTDLEPWLDAQPRLLAEVLRRIAGACARTSRSAARGIAPVAAAGTAASDERARPTLGQAAEREFTTALAACPNVAAWASEETCSITVSEEHGSGGAYLVTYDPLDGASGIEANGVVGDDLLGAAAPVPRHAGERRRLHAAGPPPGRGRLLRSMAHRRCWCSPPAGRAALFTLDPDAPAGRPLAADTRRRAGAGHDDEFAINVANQRYWEKPVQRYVAECLAGAAGPRGRDFDMRWVASMVAEAHRILARGGVFLYPRDTRSRTAPAACA